MYAETTQSIRDVNENFRNADHSPLRGKAISYVNSMSFDENRFEKKGDSINIHIGEKKPEEAPYALNHQSNISNDFLRLKIKERLAIEQ